jgi:predicted peptidase
MRKPFSITISKILFAGIILYTGYWSTTAYAHNRKSNAKNNQVLFKENKDSVNKSIDPLHPDYTADPLKKWEGKFSDFSFHVYKKDGHTLPYRFHQPANTVAQKKYPLVLFFHGAGERGLDNRLQFLRFTTVPFWEKYPCYILAPQCPPRPEKGPDGEDVWVQTNFGANTHTMKEKPSWPMGLSIALLDKIIKENNIDTTRIYVTGLSMGGFATWEILQREGKKFAAAMPVCGGGDLTYAGQFINLPLWVFHGNVDTTVPVKRSRDMVAAIIKAGGNPGYSEFPGVGHGAWAVTYNDQKIWDWLFMQHK